MFPEEPQPQNPRRVHPLEREPRPAAPNPETPPSQRAVLHIRTVRPYITYGLIVVNVLIFIIGFFDPTRELQMFLSGANNRDLVLVDGEFYRLFTSMFLHGSLPHVVFNMFSLYIIGSNLEAIYGHVRFGIIYLLGGLTGALLSTLLSDVYSVGASGAVFAVFGGQIVFLYRHRKLLGRAGQAQMRQMVLIALMNFIVGIASSLSAQGVSIDNWAHIGGFVGGLVLAAYIGSYYLLERYHSGATNEFMAVDINPLKGRMQNVMIYTSSLLSVLIVAMFLARGGA